MDAVALYLDPLRNHDKILITRHQSHMNGLFFRIIGVSGPMMLRSQKASPSHFN